MIVVTAAVVGAAWYLVPAPTQWGPNWSIPEPNQIVGGTLSGDSYYLATETTSPDSTPCGGSTLLNFSVTKLNLSTGTVDWVSPPVGVDCSFWTGFTQRVAVLPDRIVLAITMNGVTQNGSSRLFLASYSTGTGAAMGNATFSQAGPRGLDPGVADWPVGGGVLITWTTPGATWYNLTAYSMEGLAVAWNAMIRVPSVGVGVTESADYPNASPGGFADANEFCLTTDPENLFGEYRTSDFHFQNASIACLATTDGHLLWQRNLSGPSAPDLGGRSASTLYYLDNSSGALRVEGVNLTTGANVTDFPVQGLSSAPVATVSVEFVARELLVATTGPFGAYESPDPRTPWGDYQAYTLNGVRLWNTTIPEDAPGLQSGAYYYVELPMAVTGGRLLLGDLLGGTYDTTPGATYQQSFEVVNASTGAVLEQHTIDIVKEQFGQYSGPYIGAWYPILTVGSMLLYYSEGNLAAATF